MSSSAKRVQKLRNDQTDEERKAQNAKDAERMRKKRAAAKNAKIKDPQQRDQKTPHESSSLSHGLDDSGFDTMNVLEATSISSQCATTMTPVRGSSFRGSRKGSESTDDKSASRRIDGSLFAQHDNRDSQFSCGDAANILYALHVFHCSFFAQHDNRDSQFSCGDAANILNTT